MEAVYVPPEFVSGRIGCGFRVSAQLMIAISDHQNLVDATRPPHGPSESCAPRQWSQLREDLTGESAPPPKQLRFAEPPDTPPLLKALMRPICFANHGVSFRFDPRFGALLLNAVRNADPTVAAFTIFWFESLVLVDPSVVFSIVDEIFRVIPEPHVGNLAGLHAFVHCRSVTLLMSNAWIFIRSLFCPMCSEPSRSSLCPQTF
jgi:hypothetical protein